MTRLFENLAIIGSSAGGPRILREVFTGLPKLNCAMVLVQHMPQFVNQSICNDINTMTGMDVVLGEHRQKLETGRIYIAPTDYHVVLCDNAEIRLIQTEKVNFVRPAVDVTMMSVQAFEHGTLMGIVLTGMGKDGASGIVHLKNQGAITIAQNESTSIIYGMPKEAVATGCVDYEMAPLQIQSKMVQVFGRISEDRI